jgi:hypothetical protein
MIAAILSSPRRALVALVTVFAATGVAVGSGASFTSHSANAANTFTSGTLLQTNSASGAAVVTGANLKPGDVKTGDVTIKNTGTLAGDFKLTETNATNAFTSGVLQVKVEDVTTAATKSVYSGDFEKLGTVALGSFAAGEARTYRVTVTLAQSAVNADQGKTATADFEWDAVQS